MKLSQVQRETVHSIVEGFQTHRVQMLAWYTGSGKTNIFLAVCRELIKQNPKIRIGISAYLHRNIKEQSAARASTFLDSYTTVNAGEKICQKSNVVIFNPQGFIRRKRLFNFDVLIIDEAHVGIGEKNRYMTSLLKNQCSPDVKILACSATPWNVINSPILKGAKLYLRGLHKGLLEDKRIQDFKIHAERIDLNLRKKDFAESGNLLSKYINSNYDVLKKLCVQKVEKIRSEHDAKLGNKCLIIVPPGDECGIAKALANEIGPRASYLIGGGRVGGYRYQALEKETMREFREDPKKRFLIVVHKCQIGFDMPELSSTIDLTMSRNISLVVQRWGRLARKTHHDRSKHYFYVFDNQIVPEDVDWILGTSIDYAIGNWAKDPNERQREGGTRIFNVSEGKKEFTVDFAHLAKMHLGMIRSTHNTTLFSDQVKIKQNTWSRQTMLEEAAKFSSRTELSKKNRYIYKQLLKFYPEDLEAVFPIINHLGRWSLEKAIAAAKECASRKEFKLRYSGAYDVIYKVGQTKILDELFGPRTLWDVKNALAMANQYRKISLFKKKQPGAHGFLYKYHNEMLNSIFIKKEQKQSKGE